MVEERDFDRWPNCPVDLFPFIFQEMSNDDLCQTDCVPFNPSGQLVEECEKNNISKTQHDSTVDSRDMATGALLVFSKICTSLSVRIFSIVSHPFFFWTGGLFCSFICTFSPNYNFFPYLYLYVFYFIFHINYVVYFCLNR
jgi:hypothetical protein